MTNNLCTIQNCLTTMMGRHYSIEAIRNDMELMIEKLTHVTLALRRLKIQMEEYVCLKVIVLLNQGKNDNSIACTYINISSSFFPLYRRGSQRQYRKKLRFEETIFSLVPLFYFYAFQGEIYKRKYSYPPQRGPLNHLLRCSGYLYSDGILLPFTIEGGRELPLTSKWFICGLPIERGLYKHAVHSVHAL